MQHRTIALQLMLTSCISIACNTAEPAKPIVNISEPPPGPALANTAELKPAPSSGEFSSTSDVTTVRNVLPPNPATVGASLGRSFQGEIVAEVTYPNQKQPATLRYMASGDRMRMRMDGSTSDFDLVADGKTLAVLDHVKHSYRRFDLSQLSSDPVPKDVGADRKNDLKDSENEDAVTFQAGLRCEEHTITGPRTEIHACVAALPGAFERAVFERATGLRTPAWLATLVDDDEMPLRVRGHYGDSGEFTATVIRYAPEPLPDAAFIIPVNYAVESI